MRAWWAVLIPILGCYEAHGDSVDDTAGDCADVAPPDGAPADEADRPSTEDGTSDACVPDCSTRECGDDGCGGTCPPGCEAGFGCNSLGRCGPTETCAGGWLDPTTDLCWQDPPEDDVRGTQPQGAAYCASLIRGGLASGSWHLPTIGELRSLIRGCPDTDMDGPCNVGETCTDPRCVNPACTGCVGWAGPGSAGQYWPADIRGTGTYFWSSTPYTDGSENAGFAVHFDAGRIVADNSANPKRLRCVRPDS